MDTNPSDSFAHTFPEAFPNPLFPEAFLWDGSKLFPGQGDADAHLGTHRPHTHTNTHTGEIRCAHTGAPSGQAAERPEGRCPDLNPEQNHYHSVVTHGAVCVCVCVCVLTDGWVGCGVCVRVPGVRLLRTCSMWGPGAWRVGMERYGRRQKAS